ncbi:hypothetical protein SMICM17S_04050 [Streptomyces microflavus]
MLLQELLNSPGRYRVSVRPSVTRTASYATFFPIRPCRQTASTAPSPDRASRGTVDAYTPSASFRVLPVPTATATREACCAFSWVASGRSWATRVSASGPNHTRSTAGSRPGSSRVRSVARSRPRRRPSVAVTTSRASGEKSARPRRWSNEEPVSPNSPPRTFRSRPSTAGPSFPAGFTSCQTRVPPSFVDR